MKNATETLDEILKVLLDIHESLKPVCKGKCTFNGGLLTGYDRDCRVHNLCKR